MLLFADSFDDYTSLATMYASGTRWFQNSASSYFNISSTGGRTGGPTLMMFQNLLGGTGRYLWSQFPQGPRSAFRFAGWFRRYGEGLSLSAIGQIMQFSTASGAAMGCIGMNESGQILAYPAGRTGATAGSFFGTGTTNCFDLAWHFIEGSVHFHASTGHYKVWVDGSLEIDVAGNTIYSGDGIAHGCRMQSIIDTSSPRSFYWDDVMFWDDTDIGDGFVGHLDGVRIIKTVRPTSDASVQFTPSSGSDNFSRVNQQVLNTASYVESETDGNTDRYGFAASGLADVAIRGVIVEANIINPGAGSIGCKMVAELAATIGESAAIAVPGGASPRQASFPAKPGGGAWSIADVEAATYGIRVSVP
jgi:hypothetical protein